MSKKILYWITQIFSMLFVILVWLNLALDIYTMCKRDLGRALRYETDLMIYLDYIIPFILLTILLATLEYLLFTFFIKKTFNIK